jgi:hypothetical protein
MSIVVTWQTDGGAVTTWTSTAEVRASLDAYRLTLQDFTPTTQNDPLGNPYTAWVASLRYTDIQSMLIGEFKKQLVTPAMQAFTPASVSDAATVLVTAAAAYQQALTTAGATPAVSARNVWPANTSNLLHGGFTTDGAEWTGSSVAAPDGTNNGGPLAESTSGGAAVHRYYIASDMGAGQFTLSMHFRPFANNWVYLSATVDGSDYRCWFNLGSGVVGTNTFPGGTAAITGPFGGGWYRCSVTFTAVTSTTFCGCGHAPADTVFSYAGTSPNGVYQWGQQLEVGTLSDYQPIPAWSPTLR